MKPAFWVAAAAVVSTLAFPPFGPGFLIVVGVTLFLVALRSVSTPRGGFWAGFAYGTLFIGLLMWWLSNLHWTALALAPVQGVFFGAYGWWLSRQQGRAAWAWLALAVGGWAITEMIRYRIPYGGMEWGAAGYALSDSLATRYPAAVVGTSGLTVLVVLVAGISALAVTGRFEHRLWWGLVALALVYGITAPVALGATQEGETLRVAIVQGSTPCPFTHCGPDERLRTYEQHLDLTRTIVAGSVDLVVWPEGSLGSTNADPVQNPEVAAAMAAEARRLDAWILAGSDRPLNATHWVNANVVMSPEGEIVGEYRKQLPVPFGEFIPFRPFFTALIPELARVPRDMIPGQGPVVFDLGSARLGSVISWEGGFSRFARGHVVEGANLLVVATNNGSYGPDSPTSHIFIGMTRMRATELGLDLVHGAVTGRSVIIDSRGDLVTEPTEMGEQAIVRGEVTPKASSLYARAGDVLMIAAAAVALAVWTRGVRLVGSRPDEEE